MIKQVIVMRTHYPDGKGGLRKLRTGKMVSQGAHASLGAILRSNPKWMYANPTQFILHPDSDAQAWLEGKFTKIVVGVKSEDELRDLHEKAKEAGLLCALIIDAGDTEFAGVPTCTALGIGPAASERIDPITGHLPLI
jgi:PTH2 family peptidyl-tRNA hydrolase